jgi:hypothetical protein
MEAARWLTEKASEAGPELIGGFVGYMLHEVRHALFKRPRAWLIRLFGAGTRSTG